jgi:hypothetical protein
MKSPAQALAWEIWRRHKSRLLGMAALLLFFALFYSRFCAMMGLHPESPAALDDFASSLPQRFEHTPDWGRLLFVFAVFFLLLGPVASMLMSLVCIIFIFTFAELDPKRGFAFPTRLFKLPVSDGFFAGWLFAGGAAALTLVFLCWTRLVAQPNLDIFAGYPSLLAWLSLLFVVQAIVWACNGFPIIQVILLSAAVFGVGFLTSPTLQEFPYVASHRALLLSGFGLGGLVMGFVGLHQTRHGAWQGWSWDWRAILRIDWARRNSNAVDHSSLQKFRSRARAQLWFEWRQNASKFFFYVCGLSLIPFLGMAIVAADVGRLNEDDTFGLTVYLLAVPLFIYFCLGVSLSQRGIAPFLAIRPTTNGELVTARLQAIATSVVLSWLVTIVLVSLVPLFGNMPAAIESVGIPPEVLARLRPLLPILLLGLVVITWRFVAADLLLGLTGKRWGVKTAVLKFYAGLVFAGIIALLCRNQEFAIGLARALPLLLGLALCLKFALALRATISALKSRLLSSRTVAGYILIWCVLSAVLLLPFLASFGHPRWVVSICLGVLLLLPLARVALAPAALASARHA